MNTKKSGVGLISGGLDSTVVASCMMNTYDENHFLFVNYGQKTYEKEVVSFRAIVDKLKPDSAHEIDMTWLRQVGSLGTSALFDEDTKLVTANRKLEYVPFRNANMLAAATALAEVLKANTVLIGSTGGDVTCPDNSPAFIESFRSLIKEGVMTDDAIDVSAPLIKLSKVGVVKLGLENDAPFELSWSCHNNIGALACGSCSNCEARVAAFTDLGMRDFIEYE